MFICIITTGSMVWWLIRITLGPGCPPGWLAEPGWLPGVCPWPCWSDWPVDWGWPSAGLPLADMLTVVPRFNCTKVKIKFKCWLMHKWIVMLPTKNANQLLKKKKIIFINSIAPETGKTICTKNTSMLIYKLDKPKGKNIKLSLSVFCAAWVP